MFEPHLCVVVSDPAKDASRVLLCLVATWRDGSDPACKIDPAECGPVAFVKVPSYIDYRYSFTESILQLDVLLKSETINQRPPIPPTLLYRIRQGAVDSSFIPRGARKLLLEQGLLVP
jgi:hypothetical protein